MVIRVVVDHLVPSAGGARGVSKVEARDQVAAAARTRCTEGGCEGQRPLVLKDDKSEPTGSCRATHITSRAYGIVSVEEHGQSVL